MTDLAFAALIRSQPIDVLILALEQVATATGVTRIFRAEQAGHRRWQVLTTAARRLEQIGGSEVPGCRTSILAVSVALEPGQV